jgi:hypothetical protein
LSAHSISRTVRLAAFGLAAALLVLMVSPGVSRGAGTGTIKGKVTASNGGAPIEGIEVCAYQLDGFEEACRLSKADGTYSITGLAAGKYAIEFWRRNLNYITQYYDEKEFFEEADEVTVTEGGTVSNVDAQLEEGGEIEGTVSAPSVGPLEETLVCAGTDQEFGGCAISDENGDYAIGGLRENEFTVEFIPAFGGWNYLRQFYDHKARFNEADPVAVVPGEITTGIDAEPEPGSVVEGTVFSASSGAPLPGILVCIFTVSTGDMTNCEETSGTGQYEFFALPADGYRVGFSLELREFFPSEPEENDGYLTQYYNGEPTFIAADLINLTPPEIASGIDAHLVKSARPVPPPAPIPLTLRPAFVNRTPKPHCRKGFRKRRVKGKLRCVKVHKRRHHAAHHRGRIPARLLLPVR